MNARQFWRQKNAESVTSAAISGLGHLPQLRTVYRYFASNTSGIPSQVFIPSQLFDFAGTWIDLSLPQFWNMLPGASGHSPSIVTSVSSWQLQNALPPIFTTLAGIVTEPRRPQSWKALRSIMVTLAGSVSVSRRSRPWNSDGSSRTGRDGAGIITVFLRHDHPFPSRS